MRRNRHARGNRDRSRRISFEEGNGRAQLRAARHKVIDFGAHSLSSEDDYPDVVIPLAQAVVEGKVDRGVVICGSRVGASVCANKIPGVRAALIHDHFSARQGVEDDHLNILCMGGRTVGPAVAWDLIQTFLAAEFSQAERHLRRLKKVSFLKNRTEQLRGLRHEANAQTRSPNRLSKGT
jgi:ribose 5-phosphate isomerase B